MKKLFRFCLAILIALEFANNGHADPVHGQGTWETTLQARDIDGDGTTDAFYDTDLKITWLRNANLGNGSIYDDGFSRTDGLLTWGSAVALASNLTFGGFSDWRLPDSDTCEGYTCSGSQIGHLWLIELGNAVGAPMSNSGNFTDFRPYAYWSGRKHDADIAWGFGTDYGYQNDVGSHYGFYVMAVRSGDVIVSQVPEPSTFALMALGLVSAFCFRFIRKRRN